MSELDKRAEQEAADRQRRIKLWRRVGVTIIGANAATQMALLHPSQTAAAARQVSSGLDSAAQWVGKEFHHAQKADMFGKLEEYCTGKHTTLTGFTDDMNSAVSIIPGVPSGPHHIPTIKQPNTHVTLPAGESGRSLLLCAPGDELTVAGHMGAVYIGKGAILDIRLGGAVDHAYLEQGAQLHNASSAQITEVVHK